MAGQTDELVKRITDELSRTSDLESAIANVKAGLDKMLSGLADQLSAEIDAAREIVLKQFERIEILNNHSVIRKRPQWYFGPKPTDRHWPALRDYLVSKGFEPRDVHEIDRASNEVVSLLENPSQQKFSCRGLVVGHVQSGKTANMTAVIAKALDAGYDSVIVLAGLTNKLRYQTQTRMFKDLVLRRPLDWQLYWQILTPNVIEEDFRAPAQGGFLSHTDKAQLAVIKKNGSRELFDRAKLLSAVNQSVGKFFKSDEEVDEIVASVEDALYALGESDIPSKQVGDFVLDELAGRNEVAYVRFASVYRRFKDIAGFEKELLQIRKRKIDHVAN